jgi:uncharacterized protein (TIGR00369 family)
MSTGDKPAPDEPRVFAEAIPQNKALGLELLELRGTEAMYRLPYDPRLIGNPDTGVLHGGAITTLLDAASGASVFRAVDTWSTIATLDLRIDYLRAAEVGRDLVARATCYKVTRNVAFTRAVAYHDAETDPVATAVGTFMLGTKAKR